MGILQLFLWPGLIGFTEQIDSRKINLEPVYLRGLMHDCIFPPNLLSDFLPLYIYRRRVA